MASPLLIGADQAEPPTALDNPAYQSSSKKWDRQSEFGVEEREDCRDRIEKARAEAGQLKLEREPASPDKPLMIYAVDRKEYGCSVLVMKGDVDDIRPIPEEMEGENRQFLVPAEVNAR